MAYTKIPWADMAWNPVTGCGAEVIASGCKNCYARKMSNRLAGRFGYDENFPFAVTVHPDKLDLPLTKWRNLKRNAGKRIFVNSMGDLFHRDVPFRIQEIIYETMARAPWLIFLILTKRMKQAESVLFRLRQSEFGSIYEWPLRNVRHGISVSCEKDVEELLPGLVRCPDIAHRFISAEPLLSPIEGFQGQLANEKIEWLIVGPETGPRARAIPHDSARLLYSLSKIAQVPFFWKGKGAEFPQQFPDFEVKLCQ